MADGERDMVAASRGHTGMYLRHSQNIDHTVHEHGLG